MPSPCSKPESSPLLWVNCQYCNKWFPDNVCLSWHQTHTMQCCPFDINAEPFVPASHKPLSNVEIINEVNRLLNELEHGDLYD